MQEFSIDDAEEVLATTMPGCVRDLAIKVEQLSPGNAHLRMPLSDQACREGGIYSGQALAALADTAMCFAIWTDGRGRRPVATIDLHVTYMRGGSGEDVLAHAEIVRSGRSMAFARVALSGADSKQMLATAVGTFSLPA